MSHVTIKEPSLSDAVTAGITSLKDAITAVVQANAELSRLVGEENDERLVRIREVLDENQSAVCAGCGNACPLDKLHLGQTSGGELAGPFCNPCLNDRKKLERFDGYSLFLLVHVPGALCYSRSAFSVSVIKNTLAGERASTETVPTNLLPDPENFHRSIRRIRPTEALRLGADPLLKLINRPMIDGTLRIVDNMGG